MSRASSAPIRAWAWRRLEGLLSGSIRLAVRQQGLAALVQRLAEIVPDISEQYTGFAVSGYLATKVRAQHAFQVALARDALSRVGLSGRDPLTIVDIGDSSGTHLSYLRAFEPGIRGIGVNLDAVAVEKIRARGFEALNCRAEQLSHHVERADVLLSFEMLEHLVDPVPFLRSLANGVQCRSFVITVPYVANSRVKLEYIRYGDRWSVPVTAESTHVFELAPEDWRLVFRFAGWSILTDRVYLQYPRLGIVVGLKSLWRRLDFEGFYGAVLVPDQRWSSQYPW